MLERIRLGSAMSFLLFVLFCGGASVATAARTSVDTRSSSRLARSRMPYFSDLWTDRPTTPPQPFARDGLDLHQAPHQVIVTTGQRVRSSPDIPQTQFSCTDRPPGYYADVETGCQVYHMCTEGGHHFSYRCPNTTLFQQRMLICAHAYQVNCNRTELYYANNLLIGQRDKHFVNEDPVFFPVEKELKTLQNPEALQNLGQPSRDGSFRQGKSRSSNENTFANGVFRSNNKQVIKLQENVSERSTQLPNSFITTSKPFSNSFPTTSVSFGNSFINSNSPTSNAKAPEDLSSLPIAGSVLPGGVKNFQFSQPQNTGFNSQSFPNTSPNFSQAPQKSSAFNSQTFQTTSPNFSRTSQQRTSFNSQTLQTTPPNFSRTPQQSTSFNSQSFQTTPPTFPSNFRSGSTPVFPKPIVNQQAFFTSPTPTPNSIDRINLFATTKDPISFIPKFSPENKFQPSGFKKQIFSENNFAQEISKSEPSFEFLPPNDQDIASDLMVASQENAVSSRLSTTPAPEPSQDDIIAVALPETDVKAVIEQTQNGSLPDDKFNTFLKRFNPHEELPKPTEVPKTEESDKEYHTFINRFVPNDKPLEGQLVSGYSLEQQPGDHVFVDRFVLTPDELKQEKNRNDIDKLHNILPPEDILTINFPSFDLSPPLGDDSDDSESNKIELHLQDPRHNFFIPSEEGNDFSKADAAPIIVTIPLHSSEKSTPMWFRNNESEDTCSRCHPAFIVNKETCMPCVIIR